MGMEEIGIKDPVSTKSVPADAKTIGGVMFRGNTVMNAYYKDVNATNEAFAGGCSLEDNAAAEPLEKKASPLPFPLLPRALSLLFSA
ncbi:hypothetical protein Taro_017629 [Colocasia esculenta]|uniref:Uncharacterized protein n=1 Tax=Colocasia esculenta TaxID=4460 RepID=A0A843UWM5_COLES|nr:hypothetical protein [Colocasia esculenta]